MPPFYLYQEVKTVKYKVISDFIDKEDEMHLYVKGDPYPRKGKASKERVEYLSSDKNKAGTPVIEAIKEESNG